MRNEKFYGNMDPVCPDRSVIQGEHYRISVLTQGLVRLEYSPQGCFVDAPTQTVWNRNFPACGFSAEDHGQSVEIHTLRMHLIYNKKELAPHGLSVQVTGGETWHYGQPVQGLGGTARTLDCVDGACALEPGILSRGGLGILDDSQSLLLDERGNARPRQEQEWDLYFFGYGQDYREALKAFFMLCGKTPMLPRYALGNWWSRYYEYTQESYLELLDRFQEEEIPFTVAVLDMDWHLVDIDPKYGTGWTGYTWNKEYFPDPQGFLSQLHERGMHTTLNVHPADGVRAYEESYQEMAGAMGMDPDTQLPVNFQIADEKFLKNYFQILHHPHEALGVDFWWIDWQQGTSSSVEGLDPLWMLNHYHFLDNGRDQKRPMTFSRYAGPGSHRYPVGFSGDTIVTWDSLDFQPYFTATASNIGFGWWSHDIGGHMHGYRDDELEARWLQYGVFSPIMRLHSTKNEFNGKEPWRFPMEIHQVMNRFLRLRHQLIPYLYTMNYRSWREDQPLVQPLYYEYPKEQQAYEVRNGYFFGSELLVFPVTAPGSCRIHRAKTDGWLPAGTYVDFFTGLIYHSAVNRQTAFYRDIDTIPVLAKAGAIVPMTDEIFGKDPQRNPSSLRIRVYAGADGSFCLYEDDNESCAYVDGRCAVTQMDFSWEGEQGFFIRKTRGDLSLIPKKRNYEVEFWGITDAQVQAAEEGKAVDFMKSYDQKTNVLTISIAGHDCETELHIQFQTRALLGDNQVSGRIYSLLDQAEISFDQKEQVMNLVRNRTKDLTLAGQLHARNLEEPLLGAIMEILCARE